MICKPCAEAADRGLQGPEHHRGCVGCDCMHRVGSKATILNETRLVEGKEAYVPIVPNNGGQNG